jgi:ribosomal protein S12 methylthiotransferase accessory factor
MLDRNCYLSSALLKPRVVNITNCKDMAMCKSFSNHKDIKPEQTIHTARVILAELGIYLQEKNWTRVGANCHSVRLEDMAYNQVGAVAVGTNGKGTTPLFALASAYGEYLERLQNNYLYYQHYGLMSGQESFYPDEIDVDAKSFVLQHRSLLDAWGHLSDNDFIEVAGKSITAVPFYNATKDKIEHLPELFINLFCGSNGLCAGNTPEEAILQGICEIFERNASRKIYFDNLSVPTIPPSAIESLDSGVIIQNIESKGYSLVLKDCSLGGVYPVVAVTSYDKDHNHYRTSFGADPVFDVAIQRCLTEHYQGIDNDLLPKGLRPCNDPPESDFLYPLTEI